MSGARVLLATQGGCFTVLRRFDMIELGHSHLLSLRRVLQITLFSSTNSRLDGSLARIEVGREGVRTKGALRSLQCSGVHRTRCPSVFHFHQPLFPWCAGSRRRAGTPAMSPTGPELTSGPFQLHKRTNWELMPSCAATSQIATRRLRPGPVRTMPMRRRSSSDEAASEMR
jgi:hypothetical protein